MRAAIFGILGVITLASANPVPSPPDPSDPWYRVPRPTRPLEWGDVNVLHTTDIHGWISGHSKNVYPEKSWSGNFGDFYSFVTHMREAAKQRGSDLLLVDTGDRRIGHGLTDGILDPKNVSGRYVSLLYRDMEYDLVVPGNHDLESPKLVKWTMDTLNHTWGGRYLTSNVNRANGDPLGVRCRRWTSPTGKRMMAFGVVPNKTRTPKDLLKVDPIDKMIGREWFVNAIKRDSDPNRHVDVFVLLGHVDPQTNDAADDIKLIYRAIREQHPLTPILIFAGHTHKRWCRTFEEEKVEGGVRRSMLIQSGRYFDTVGWMSVELDNNTVSRNLTFSRRYLDNNLETYMYHTGKTPANFHTKNGKAMTEFIRDAEKTEKLSKVVGELKHDYYLDRETWTEQEKDKHSLFTFYLDAVQHSLIRPDRSKNWLFFSNWGIMRSDIYRGPFSMSDLYAISPDASDDSPFLSITVPRQIADQIVKKTQEVNQVGGNLALLPTLESEIIDVRNDNSQTHFSSSPSNPEGLTYGWVTQDDCGNDGDDVRHFPIPKVILDDKSVLPVYFWRKGYTSSADEVDIIVTNRIGQKYVSKALQLLKADCGKCGLEPYREDVKQDTLLTTYVRAKFPSKSRPGKTVP